MGVKPEEITADELLKRNEINISSDEPFTNDFSHYTRRTNADKILNSESLWASRINNTNDNNERELYKENNNVFILCFCSSDREKIPMWYLYAGILGSVK